MKTNLLNRKTIALLCIATALVAGMTAGCSYRSHIAITDQTENEPPNNTVVQEVAVEPTAVPTEALKPTSAPTPALTQAPAIPESTPKPSTAPAPTAHSETSASVAVPTVSPTTVPTLAPTAAPTAVPSAVPISEPNTPSPVDQSSQNGWQPDGTEHYHGNGSDSGVCSACGLIYGPTGGTNGSYDWDDGLID